MVSEPLFSIYVWGAESAEPVPEEEQETKKTSKRERRKVRFIERNYNVDLNSKYKKLG